MIVGIVQARMSSSRLPGKVLMDLAGRPMLERQIERLGRSRRLDKVVIATSDQAADDAIENLCRNIGVEYFRGSLENVLDRFYQAALSHNPETVVRLTADCPLSDPEIIDDLVRFFENGGFDYASNTLEPTWPDGLDAEIMTFDALQTAWREAKDAAELEHVTPFLYKNPDRFSLGSFKGDEDLSHLRWTVDFQEDLDVVREVYGALYEKNPAFASADVLAFFKENPDMCEVNKGLHRSGPADHVEK